MTFKKPGTIKDLLIHLGVILGLTVTIVVILFFVWLPITTNHGESISVPDVQGMIVTELDDFLAKRDLKFEVTPDSSYTESFPPLAVLTQVPGPNTKVKENRKIYVTLNATSPPKIRMPELEDKSVKSALMALKSYGLKLGKITYEPDDFNVILETQVEGRTLLAGEIMEKGTPIDLVVGNGYGKTIFESPILIGLDREEAELVIIGSGLELGKITFTKRSSARVTTLDSAGLETQERVDVAPGSVQQQYPGPEEEINIGDPVDLWIYQPDSISNQSSILDN